jgi:hypothetical protein
MPIVVGIVLSLGVALVMNRIGFDRDRAFYPTVLIVIASYYVLFAVIGGSPRAVGLELLAATPFCLAAIAGFKTNPWIVVAAMAGHGIFDGFHGRIFDNPGVPVFWPAFCLSYDVGAAAALAWLSRPGTVHELDHANAA